MESLHIDTGAVTLSINNDENRTITFYPTDVHFAEAFFDLVRDFMQHRENVSKKEEAIKESGGTAAERSAKEVGLLRETYAFMRERIDNCFGAGTSEIVFGDHDSLGAYASFFRGVEPYVSKARKDELDRYSSGDNGTVMDA